MPASLVPMIEITNRYWYNELLNYKFYMLPGILGDPCYSNRIFTFGTESW